MYYRNCKLGKVFLVITVSISSRAPGERGVGKRRHLKSEWRLVATSRPEDSRFPSAEVGQQL